VVSCVSNLLPINLCLLAALSKLGRGITLAHEKGTVTKNLTSDVTTNVTLIRRSPSVDTNILSLVHQKFHQIFYWEFVCCLA